MLFACPKQSVALVGISAVDRRRKLAFSTAETPARQPHTVSVEWQECGLGRQLFGSQANTE